MAIAAQNLVLTGSGGSPTALTPAGNICWSFGDVQQPAFVGTATFTGDGATLAGVLNWIDGTLTLPFTPSLVLAFAVPGGSAAAGILQVEGNQAAPRVSSITATSCTINWTTAVSNAGTFKVLVVAYK